MRWTEKYRPRPDSEEGRFGDNGGKYKEWHAGFHRAKRYGKEALMLFLADNPHPKRQNTGSDWV